VTEHNGDGTATVTCPDGSTATVGCRADANEDGTVTVTCGDGSEFTVGCTVSQNANGTATIRCADGSEATVGEPVDPEPLEDATVVRGTVLTLDGEPIVGATIRSQGTESISDDSGAYSLELEAQDAVVIRVDADSYLPAVKSSAVVDRHPTMIHFRLLPANAPEPFDADIGGRIGSSRGAAVILPPGGIVDENGRVIDGQADISITPLDPSVPSEMEHLPGSMLGVSGDNELTQLESFGMLNVEMTRDGDELQLGPGHSATIEIPIPSGELPDGVELPVEIPLWHLDEDTNQWREEGTARLDLERGVYVGQVQHFSTWNADIPSTSTCIEGHLIDRNNRPVGGARIRNRGISYFGGSRTVSRPDGTFRMPVRRGGESVLTAQHHPLDPSHPRLVRAGDVPTRLPLRDDDRWCLDIGEILIARAPAIRRQPNLEEPPEVPDNEGDEEPPEEREGELEDFTCDRMPLYELRQAVRGFIDESDEAVTTDCFGVGQRPLPGDVYRVVAHQDGPVCFTTTSRTLDSLISIRAEGCFQESEVACNDDAGNQLRSQAQVNARTGLIYYVAVMGFGEGEYVLVGNSGRCP